MFVNDPSLSGTSEAKATVEIIKSIQRINLAVLCELAMRNQAVHGWGRKASNGSERFFRQKTIDHVLPNVKKIEWIFRRFVRYRLHLEEIFSRL